MRFWTKFAAFLAKNTALFLIGAYRSLASAWLGGACRFEPSCSEYAVQAFREHTPMKALSLSVNRICRCRPGGGCGYDPLPSRGHYGQSEQ